MRHFWKLRHIYENETILKNYFVLKNCFGKWDSFGNLFLKVGHKWKMRHSWKFRHFLENETFFMEKCFTYQFIEFALLPKWYNWSFCEFSGWIQSWSIWMTAGPSSDLPEPLGFWLLQSINKHKSMANDSLKNIRINMNGSCNCCMVGWRMVTKV